MAILADRDLAVVRAARAAVELVLQRLAPGGSSHASIGRGLRRRRSRCRRFLTRKEIRNLLVDVKRARRQSATIIFSGSLSKIRASGSDRRPPARCALTGLARCERYGGAIMSAHTRVYGGGHERVKVYACGRHHQRGKAVCPVTVHQRMDDVEGALVEFLQEHMLTERVLEQVIGEIREQIAAHFRSAVDVHRKEHEPHDRWAR
jgi:hypothetical protein